VFAVREAIVGTLDYAVATDLQGHVLWRYPVNARSMEEHKPTIVAADLAGTGTKQWIVRSRRGEMVVLDADGRLLARLENAGKRWRSWTAIARKNKPGWIVTADSEKLTAYVLSPLE
jgi:hypothetical protein